MQLVLACEVLKPELETLAAKMENPPEIIYLSQRLHDYPEKLRAGVQEEIDRIEQERPEITDIIMGYGLCGKGLTGVTPRRATLLFPRLHDCIPLLIGNHPDSAEASSREGTTYWISAGWLDSFLAEFHLSDARFKKYAEKFGEKRAARMVAAENALLDSYKLACHVRWQELGDRYLDTARDVAKAAGLPYGEINGASWYVNALLRGAEEEALFLRVRPGQTLDMDGNGKIIVTNAAAN